MLLLIYFLLFTLTYTTECPVKNPIEYEQIYLCREELNSTSMRIWLHIKLNQTNFFSYYIFTLRIIDLIDEHKIQRKDRYENQISDYAEIDFKKKENHTINIYNLLPGRYEICINFFHTKLSKFYYRYSNSCLYIPWNILEQEHEHPNLFIHILFMFLIIILLVTIAFFVYAVHQFFKSRKPSLLPQVAPEDTEEVCDINERARFLVNQHFVEDINPFALLVRKRMHQRYAH